MIVLFFLGTSVIPVTAFVPAPAEYFGKITINGNDAPAGTTIVARINGNVRGQFTTTSPGVYGASCLFAPRLIVQPTESDTACHCPIKVEFYVNNLKADQSPYFGSGIKWQDLSFSATDIPTTIPTTLPVTTLQTTVPTTVPTTEPTAEPTPYQDLPIPAFSADVRSGPAPLYVQFNDYSLHDPWKWNWTFGDGSHSDEQNPLHIYSVPGNYSVTLIVTNDVGSVEIASPDYIQVMLPSVIPFPGKDLNPGDTDSDGFYDDLNGNGRNDFEDIILFFNYLEWIPDNEPGILFDYNRNGRVDFNDLLILFDRL
jgi:PKD repeat protein